MTKSALTPPWFVKTFEIPIYYIDLIMVVHSDMREIDEKYGLGLKNHEGWDDPNDCHAFTQTHPVWKGKAEIYVCFKPEALDHDTIGHELCHIMSQIAIQKGIILDPANDEPIAYLQGYVSAKIYAAREKYFEEHGPGEFAS
jgi:hypothetical protein